MRCSLGLDYGTNSVRALIVDCADGREVGVAVFDYPSGRRGILLDPKDPNLARQHPGDYLLGAEESVKAAIADARRRDAEFDPQDVIGVGVDATGSSPIPVDAANVAIGTKAEFRHSLAAQCWLWKDHTSWREADQITSIAGRMRPQYIAKCGNTYSSEWFWAKIWKCALEAPEVFEAAHSWVELTDWVPSQLAGIEDVAVVARGICTAGHKALYCDEWGGLPDEEFLAELDPRLAALRSRLYDEALDASHAAGALGADWADRLGLREGIPIAMGEMDVHYGAIGSGVAEGTLVKVIGTSTCDCCVVDVSREIADIPGICGIVKGAILPGFYGIEAGQSAVGDIFRWWVEDVCEGDGALHGKLTDEAAGLAPGKSGLLALDWNNGNRTILIDQRLTGLLLGQTLHTSRAEIYRALIEATAFGARMIIERLVEYGVPIERVVCAGGIAEKNPMLMQIYADVTGREMRIAASTQACALGAAVSAAVLAGVEAGGHPDFPTAQAAMTSLRDEVYRPNRAASAVYDEIFGFYRKVHDTFGGVAIADIGDVMKGLLEIRERQRSAD